MAQMCIFSAKSFLNQRYFSFKKARLFAEKLLKEKVIDDYSILYTKEDGLPCCFIDFYTTNSEGD